MVLLKLIKIFYKKGKEGVVLLHITVGVYANGTMKHNIVAEEDLEGHIKYNLDLRPGRAFFVDGICKNKGYLSDEKISEWEEKIKHMEFNTSHPTRPYV